MVRMQIDRACTLPGTQLIGLGEAAAEYLCH